MAAKRLTMKDLKAELDRQHKTITLYDNMIGAALERIDQATAATQLLDAVVREANERLARFEDRLLDNQRDIHGLQDWRLRKQESGYTSFQYSTFIAEQLNGGKHPADVLRNFGEEAGVPIYEIMRCARFYNGDRAAYDL